MTSLASAPRRPRAEIARSTPPSCRPILNSDAIVGPTRVRWRCSNRKERTAVGSLGCRWRGAWRLPAAGKGFGAEENRKAATQQSFDELSNCVAEKLAGTNIFLVGMMGSGKSTVGRLLSTGLKYAFFDMDSLIEEVTKQTIPEIFAEFGEDGFRDVETQVLKSIHQYKNCVVATGGGAVLKKTNWSYLHQGIVVWLNGPTSLLTRRVVDDGIKSRPLVSGNVGNQQGQEENEYEKVFQKLEGILNERRSMYKIADFEISLSSSTENEDGSSGAPADEIAFRIVKAMDERIKEAAQMMEERKKFTIVRDGDSKTENSGQQKFWERINELRKENGKNSRILDTNENKEPDNGTQ